ncbi:MAG: hypothetical protein J0G95_10760 [Rhizobiales bacterium]|nr:hypothetical protein [Hyphomicrobiales bacterium]
MHEEGNWTVDRKIPLAMIFAIAVQTGTFVWWMAGINERVNVLEKASAAVTVAAPVQSDRLTRVESRVESAQRDLAEIKADVKSLIRRDAAK